MPILDLGTRRIRSPRGSWVAPRPLLNLIRTLLVSLNRRLWRSWRSVWQVWHFVVVLNQKRGLNSKKAAEISAAFLFSVGVNLSLTTQSQASDAQCEQCQSRRLRNARRIGLGAATNSATISSPISAIFCQDTRVGRSRGSRNCSPNSSICEGGAICEDKVVRILVNEQNIVGRRCIFCKACGFSLKCFAVIINFNTANSLARSFCDFNKTILLNVRNHIKLLHYPSYPHLHSLYENHHHSLYNNVTHYYCMK